MSLKKMFYTVVFLGSGMLGSAAAGGGAPIDTSDFDSFLKSFNLSLEEFQAKVGSTRMFGGSAPVSFSGEGRVKAQYHLLKSDQPWMVPDRSYIATGWEGNESMIRMGMVARAGRNTVLYSKIGFQNTLPGLVTNLDKGADGFAEAQTRHDKMLVTANIHEDMSAGIAIRTVPVSFWLRMGNINWVEASPFTIWKSQPRTFAWEFLPYEIEQPIARYYDYNIAKGEKAGRAAWHKKPFNGICLESINMPNNLYLDLLWGTFERYDNFEHEYIDFAGDRTYTEDFPLKGTGIGDSYRHIFHARLATMKIFGDMALGLNVNRFNYSDNIINSKDQAANRFYDIFKIVSVAKAAANKFTRSDSMSGTGFYKEPIIASVDLRGPICNKLFDIHTDVAVSRIDTTFLIWKMADTLNKGTPSQQVLLDSSQRFEKRVSSSAFAPAFFTKFKANTSVPFQLDVAAIAKGFYSPMSFVAPNDAFFPFGSNLVGSGKFLSRQEASPYVQNMAGAQIAVMPKLSGYGHLRMAYGQHFQLEPGRDLLYIPYRLNGLDFFSLFHSSYDRWGSGHIEWSTTGNYPTYRNRAGDESFKSYNYKGPTGLEGGGVFNDYLSTYECFVAYKDSADVRRNKKAFSNNVGYSRTVDSITSVTGFVPVSRKFTNNVEFDFSYDISDMIGYANNLFVGGYAAVNNVSTSFSPIATGSKGDKIQLWSLYLRFEPAIALTKKFYLLGLVGYENWKSAQAWMNIDNADAKLVNNYMTSADSVAFAAGARQFNVPIDFRDVAFGIGFDWEMLSRVGLHGRIKYMSHTDNTFTYNNWSTPIVSLEIKTWF